MFSDMERVYSLHQMCHERLLDEAKRERDVREARRMSASDRGAWFGHLTHFVTAVRQKWAESHQALQGDLHRRGLTLKTK